MNTNSLSGMWEAIAPELGNHLWQSTLFACVVALLALALRKNQARTRYWLWLTASVKFLIPFSLLVGIGSHLAWPHTAVTTKAGVYVAMEEMSEPFTQPVISQLAPAQLTEQRVYPATSMAVPAIPTRKLVHLLLAILAAIWFCGFVVVFAMWLMRWHRIAVAMRRAITMVEGREVEALRRVERMGGHRRRTDLLLSPALLEPGIFRILHPVLLWPEGISQHLDEAQLEAILAHEMCHIRRRDNLTAVLHMMVEIIFWFHPLVWWLEARLVEERECACDEEVLLLGNQPQVYAESILKVCEFCVGSPLVCVTGVTGADLKKRMGDIMSNRVALKLDLSRKLLLVAAGVMAVGVPVVFGQMSASLRAAMLAPMRPLESMLAPVSMGESIAQPEVASKPAEETPAASTGPGSEMVTVSGSARRPGEYIIGPQSTLLNVIRSAGGPISKSDMRDIQLQRGGKTIAHLDLYDLLRDDLSKDVKLAPGDTVLFRWAQIPGAMDEKVMMLYDPAFTGEESPYGRVYSPGMVNLTPPELIQGTLAMPAASEPISDIERICIVDFIVDSSGAPHITGVRRHSSDEGFNARWVQAIEQTRWRPAVFYGRPVSAKWMLMGEVPMPAQAVMPYQSQAAAPPQETQAKELNMFRALVEYMEYRQAAQPAQGQSNHSPMPSNPGLKAGAEILSDTQSVDFNAYLRQLHDIIQNNWDPLIPEEVQAPRSAKGITGIRFTILPNGDLSNPILETRSGDQALDLAAWGAIRAGGFPPLPKEFHGPNIELRCGFYVNEPLPNDPPQGHHLLVPTCDPNKEDCGIGG